MIYPKFLMADNTDYPESNFVIHTDFPRFIIDLTTDEIEFLEDLDKSEQAELEAEMASLIDMATEFYDSEIEKYEA